MAAKQSQETLCSGGEREKKRKTQNDEAYVDKSSVAVGHSSCCSADRYHSKIKNGPRTRPVISTCPLKIKSGSQCLRYSQTRRYFNVFLFTKGSLVVKLKGEVKLLFIFQKYIVFCRFNLGMI